MKGYIVVRYVGMYTDYNLIVGIFSCNDKAQKALNRYTYLMEDCIIDPFKKQVMREYDGVAKDMDILELDIHDEGEISNNKIYFLIEDMGFHGEYDSEIRFLTGSKDELNKQMEILCEEERIKNHPFPSNYFYFSLILDDKICFGNKEWKSLKRTRSTREPRIH